METQSSTAPVVTPSLEDIHSTVPIPRSWWRRFLAFSGPAFLISVGYMDPGNWGADLEAGSKFGYSLLWVLLVSNLMALLLQTLSTRLGVATGHDLAQACRENYPRRTVVCLWILTEIAIAATDLAEVIGTIIALKLLFNWPYLVGLAVAAGDTFLLLALQRRGVRLVELITLGLVAVIGVSFFVEIVFARPDWVAVLHGFMPGLPGATDAERSKSFYIASAMLGATVMPHNLYLHSALVQTRAFPHTQTGKQLACKYNFLDSLLALNGAFFINAAILVLAAATFFGQEEVETLQHAHKLLNPLLGVTAASMIFAIALLASGQSSTLTGTLAGQVVMEGFVNLRVRPWVRRLVTRLLAILPAILVLALASGGEGPASDNRLLDLLVLSQVILSFQLPFAIIPLIQMTSDRARMGSFANGVWLKGIAWGSAILVVALNVALIGLKMGEWGDGLKKDGLSPLWIYGTIGPVSLALLVFLGWVTMYRRRRPVAEEPGLTPPDLPSVVYRRVGVAIEFGNHDPAVLARAAAVVREQHDAELVVIHIVEGVGAEFYGVATAGRESQADRTRMTEMVEHLRSQGLRAQGTLGFGSPADEMVRLVKEERLDLLVLGTHGHRFFADLALGATVAPLLHRLTIPVLVVPTGSAGLRASEKFATDKHR